MRATRLVLPWSAAVLFSGAIAGCAATASHAADGLRSADASLTQATPDEWRQLRDSAKAQEVADEVGPRVSVTADFDYSESRHVDVTFHMYDDAYVIVGHLDASGRLKIVFPSSPGDDGFVRGDKLYHIPSFFAGFADEYSWDYSQYRYRYHDAASRVDSYDAGLAYVFVIASWRPLRLDRISDGNKWESYDISDVSYMHDPREAVEELGSLIAGDNREAYTIEYAHYYTTNYGNYSLSSFDVLNNNYYNNNYYSACSGFSPFGYLGMFGFPGAFFNDYSFLPAGGFGFASGCNRGYNGYYGGYYGYPVAYTPPGIPPRIHPTVPIGKPIFHFPSAGGTVAVHRPQVDGGTQVPSGRNAGAAITYGSSTYHRPGLITEDAPGGSIRGQGRVTGSEMGLTSTKRPTIQQMIGSRQIDDDARGTTGLRDAGIRNVGTRENGWSSTNRGGTTVTRGGETGTRAGMGSGRSFNGESHGYTPSARTAPARMEPTHSAPHAQASHSAPSHSEPARSAPASSGSSSSGSSKKP